jgi:phenylalanyl-tRNA synthetase beta chain
MKLSVNWLKEFTDIDLPVDKLVEKIGAQLGAVEEVIDLGKAYRGIVVVKIVTCAKHPNADKLSLCMVDDGGKVKGVDRDKDGLVQVVCGAPNVKAGMLAAWLPPGATVPSSFDKEPFVLEARELRGYVSNGMLASAHELALSDDHNGIAELSFGEPGEDFAALVGLDDYIIDVENKMFTHRPDCFGILGVAREIAGITGKQFKSPLWYSGQDTKPSPKSAKLQLDVVNNISKLVPRFASQVVEGVEVKASPVWMQAYLSRVGMRPVNNIVDVTNYTMYLTAQPLHAYDYDKLCKVAKTKTAKLETRLSRKGDKLKLLSGKTVTFEDNETILITSNDIPVGIGGIMGGADTEVDENTRNIVLECANFDMYAIRRASMRLGLFTDAVTRFNKGQSSLQIPGVLHKAAAWVTELAGGTLSVTVDKHQKLNKPITVHVTADFINDRLGFKMPIGEMAALLEYVEFSVRINGPTLAVTPPFWRTDIELPEDVVEEVGRLFGFDHLPVELPMRSIAPPQTNPVLDMKSQMRNNLSAAGANEVLTYSFVHSNLISRAGQESKLAYELANALSPDLQYYRLSLTPSLLEKVHPNIKAGHEKFAVFEIGKTHNKKRVDPKSKLPEELQKTALVLASGAKADQAVPAYFEARLYLDNLLNCLNIEPSYEPLKAEDCQSARPFDPSRSAVVYDKSNGQRLGIVGEYKASLRQSLKLPVHCAGFELSTAKLLGSSKPRAYRQLSKYPSLTQDICLRVASSVTYAQLLSLVEQVLSNAPENTEVSPIDIYQSDNAHKQITFRVKVTSYERTLQDAYVSELLDAVEQQAKKELSAIRI